MVGADAGALVNAVVRGTGHRVRGGAEAGVDHAGEHGALVEGHHAAPLRRGAGAEARRHPVFFVRYGRRRGDGPRRGRSRVAAEAEGHHGVFAALGVVHLDAFWGVVQEEAEETAALSAELAPLETGLV